MGWEAYFGFQSVFDKEGIKAMINNVMITNDSIDSMVARVNNNYINAANMALKRSNINLKDVEIWITRNGSIKVCAR